MRHTLLLLSLSSLLGCSGNDGSAGASAGTGGSVYVVIDTATGTDALAQIEVGAAVLERSDGTMTGNLLREITLVTFADPSGEAAGLALRDVPAGDYERLHLMLVPGTGTVVFGDGVRQPLPAPIEESVPIADGLRHDAGSDSWLVVGHDKNPIVSTIAGRFWSPALSGRDEGTDQELVGLHPVFLAGGDITATFPAAGDGVLRLDLAPHCTFAGENGNPTTRGDFLSHVTPDDELRIRADLARDGRCLASHVWRARRNDGPRLIGRITELRPLTTAFVLHVVAQTRTGGQILLETPVDVLVLAADARIHRSNCREELVFADLEVGQLAKVTWTERVQVPGALDEFTARSIEIPAAPGEPLRAQWQGRVSAVDVLGSTITVVPRHGLGILVGGVFVPEVAVLVGPSTVLTRKPWPGGGGPMAIGLEDVVPGGDRVWFRGEVTGPAAVAATRVRVRTE